MPKCTYLLTLLPVLCKHCRRLADIFVFQQDSAPAHRARDTLELLQRDTPEFTAPDLWPPNSPDLNPVYGFTFARVMIKNQVSCFFETVYLCCHVMSQRRRRGATVGCVDESLTTSDVCHV